MEPLASSFADPADLRRFKACKSRGGTDQECFKVGDNGIGCWGDLTAQEHTPMCALPPQDMEEKWGSVANAKHKRVRVTILGRKRNTTKTVICILADRMPRKPNRSGAGIDLNPAASAALGLTPPHLATVQWEWAE